MKPFEKEYESERNLYGIDIARRNPLKKGLYVIFAFFMTIGLKNYAFGQQEGFVSTLPVSYHIRSSYVVSAFPKIPSPLSAMKDTLGPPINILNVSYGAVSYTHLTLPTNREV